MFLSKRKSGIYYLYYYTLDGTKKSLSTKRKTKKDAHKFLLSFQSRLDWIEANRVNPISFKNFRWEYLKYSETVHTVKTTRANRDTFDFALDYFGDIPLTDFTPKMMSDYIQFRIRKSSLYQARKDHINLSAALNKAIQDGYLIINPLKGIKRIKLPEKQPVFYSKEDFDKLIEAIDNPDIQDLVKFDVNTGLRLGEVTSLMRDQFNEKDRLITLTNHIFLTKGKRVRSIPLNDTAFEIAMRRLETCNGHIFSINGSPIDNDRFSRDFKKYVRKAKLNDRLTFHSLRHTFASWLIQKGVPIYNVSKLLGHADIKTTEIYSHLRTDDLRESVNFL